MYNILVQVSANERLFTHTYTLYLIFIIFQLLIEKAQTYGSEGTEAHATTQTHTMTEPNSAPTVCVCVCICMCVWVCMYACVCMHVRVYV